MSGSVPYDAAITSSSSVHVRIADVDDAPALAHLRFFWRDGERNGSGLDEAAFAAAMRAWMRVNATTHIPFLGLGEAGPVAMGWLAIVNRVPSPRVFIRRSAYVQSVYVVPESRCKGMGQALTRCIIEHARSLDLDYLAVHPSERGMSLFQRFGFSETTQVLELKC